MVSNQSQIIEAKTRGFLPGFLSPKYLAEAIRPAVPRRTSANLFTKGKYFYSSRAFILPREKLAIDASSKDTVTTML